jgi:hypothetical protein
MDNARIAARSDIGHRVIRFEALGEHISTRMWIIY